MGPATGSKRTVLIVLFGLLFVLPPAAQAAESDANLSRLLAGIGKCWRVTVHTGAGADAAPSDLKAQPPRVLRLVGVATDGKTTCVQLSLSPAAWENSPAAAGPPTSCLLWLAIEDGRLVRVEKVLAGKDGRMVLPGSPADLGGPEQRVLAEFFLPGWLRGSAVRTGRLRDLTAAADGSDATILIDAERRCRVQWTDGEDLLPAEMAVTPKDAARPLIRVELAPIARTEADAAVARARQHAEASGAAAIASAEVARALGLNLTALAAAPEPDRTDWEFFSWRPRVFRPLLADPREARARVAVMRGRRADNLLDAAIGGDVALAWRRLAPEEEVSVSARGLFTARLDLCESSFPLLNSDYLGGLAVGYRKGDHAVEAFAYHVSSHLGDEVLENGQRQRIDYSRETLRVLYARDFGPLRLYAGPSINLRAYPSDLSGKLTLQLGAEYQWRMWDLPMYAAIDVQSKQEHDWSANVAAQYGIWLGDPLRQRMKQRVFIEAFSGHSNMGQFWDVYERTVAIGYGLDF